MTQKNSMPQGKVEMEVDQQGVATIEFSHPQSNSLPGNLLAGMAEHIQQAGNSSEVKVILLKSAGERAFCAGASFDELLSITDLESGRLFFSGFANVINAMRKVPKFVLCRVQGKAVGGGVGIASAADLTFGTGFSSVKLSELSIGIGPFVVGPAVQRKIGTAAFGQMSIDATRWFTAEWAQQKGLFADIFDTTEKMDSVIDELLGRLSGSSPEAMAALKRTCWEGTEHWGRLLIERAEISGKLVLTDFFLNAMAKFKKGER